MRGLAFFLHFDGRHTYSLIALRAAVVFAELWDVNMKRWFKDMRVFEQIDGAGHWLQLEATEEVNAKLLGFLETVRGLP